MKHKIISLSGFKGHGKDTVGNILHAHAGYTCISFAQPLKQMLSIQFGWPLHMLEGVTLESRMWREEPDPYWSNKLGRPFSPRQALTEIGTDLIRKKFLDTQWCDLMQKQLQNVSGPVVITDARFPNELSMIKKLGGTTVWVKRCPLPSWYDWSLWANSWPQPVRPMLRKVVPALKHVHASEQAWVGWQFDHVIDNSGSLETLETKVKNWLDSQQS